MFINWEPNTAKQIFDLSKPIVYKYVLTGKDYYEMGTEITYPFPNFNDAAVEIWEMSSNFVSYVTGCLITYPCWYYK